MTDIQMAIIFYYGDIKKPYRNLILKGLYLLQKKERGEIVEVRKGKWVETRTKGLYKCSECGHPLSDITRNYCSKCGAKMN